MHYNRELIIKNINDGEAFLGIEFGSTRIKPPLDKAPDSLYTMQHEQRSC